MDAPDDTLPVSPEPPAPRPRRTPAQKVRLIIEGLTGPWTRQNLYGWLLVIAAVMLIRWLWFEPFVIPSESMEPTLHGDPRFLQGDRVAVNKFIYGPRVPFMNKRFFRFRKPERWDIVVFAPTPACGEREDLIKRVVGLPGERIQIRGGHVCVNGIPVEPPEDAPRDIQYYNDDDFRRFIATIAPAEARPTLERIREKYPWRYGILPQDEFSVVPEGHYFVLGDNSGNSVDGRYYGWVPLDHFVGRAFCVWWPVARWRDFTGFSRAWWGQAVLYGAPSLILLYEVVQYLRQWRARRAQVRSGPGPA